MAEQLGLFGTDPKPTTRGGADISECGMYRYDLWRYWGPYPRMVFVLLNPSTANANQDDPTLRRCIAFAKREGCGAVRIVNLYAYRTPDPRALFQARLRGIDVVGPRNAYPLAAKLDSTDIVVAGWGSDKQVEWSRVEAVLSQPGVRLRCFGTNENGSPKHPLYLRADAPLGFLDVDRKYSVLGNVYTEWFRSLENEQKGAVRGLAKPFCWVELSELAAPNDEPHAVRGKLREQGPDSAPIEAGARLDTGNVWCSVCTGKETNGRRLWSVVPCEHALALIALWIGGHPMPRELVST